MKVQVAKKRSTAVISQKKSRDAHLSRHVHQILQLVYEQIDQRIWQKAVAIYRSGELTMPEIADELISSAIDDPRAPLGRWQVRFKLHGGGRAVRWFECGCSYARRTGGLCEHLLAVFIMVCRERPQYLLGLNANSPFSMVALNGSARGRSAPKPATQIHPQRSAGYVFDLIALAEIHQVDVHPHRGSCQISFELRRSFRDIIQLDIDETKFMLSHPPLLELCQTYVGELDVLPLTAEPGWKVVKSDHSETWHGEKKIFLWVDDADTDVIDKFNLLTRSTQSALKEDATQVQQPLVVKEEYGAYLVKKKRYLLTKSMSAPPLNQYDEASAAELNQELPELYASRTLYSLNREQVVESLGKKSFYLAGVGYVNFQVLPDRSIWNKPAHRAVFRGKEIDRLIATEFRVLRACPTIVSKTWLQESIHDVKIIRIELYSYDGYQFVLDPKYMVAGRVCSVSQLLKLAKDKNRHFIYENNHWIRVPDILLDLDFQLTEDGSAFRLDTIALLRWRSLFGRLDELWSGEAHLLKDLYDQMAFHDTQADEIDLSHTSLKLRDYQIEGLRWLWWLYKNRLHGLLADDMGLGKTHQTMALLAVILTKEVREQDHPRFLVICPTTVVGHWHEKIDEFAPILKPLRYHGGQREIKLGYTTLITSYGVLLRDVELLTKMQWDVVLCDEAHVIKNPKTSTYWACRRLNAHMRICLSGTPIENRLYELKTLFDFLLPGYLGTQAFFKKYYEVSGSQAGEVHSAPQPADSKESGLLSPLVDDASDQALARSQTNYADLAEPLAHQAPAPQNSTTAPNIELADAVTTSDAETTQLLLLQQATEREGRLKRLIEPLKMRRTKSQVLDDLPEKIEDIRHCRLSSRQKELYQQTLDERAHHLLDVLNDRSKPLPYLHVFSLLQRLKQICNHPALITKEPWQQEPSEKFELLKELLDESLNSSHKVVIFSQYVKMIEIITAYLDQQQINHVTLVGHSKNRDQLVAKFQHDPQVSVFVGSLLAGGVGIDLTAASVVIHYDRWWNASKENQATDRVHRIGQKNSLLVLKLVTLDTIEEKIDQMIMKKQKLFDVFMAQNPAHFKQFSRDELINLVSSDFSI